MAVAPSLVDTPEIHKNLTATAMWFLCFSVRLIRDFELYWLWFFCCWIKVATVPSGSMIGFTYTKKA